MAKVPEDHLDKETSVSAKLTENGVEARARSRIVAAADRFGGNLFELLNAPMERRIAKERAISVGEIELIDAAVRYGVDQLKHDPQFAQRAAGQFFEGMFKKQINKDGVLIEALEDLRHNPPDSDDMASGPAEIPEETMARIEEYSGSASTEQLRQKWGRVLSTEVRKPGTFSAKVLRVIDELDASTAAMFEKLCSDQFGNAVPKALSGKLPFAQRNILAMAGLVVDGEGHVIEYRKRKAAEQDYWMIWTGTQVIAIPPEREMPPWSEDERLAVYKTSKGLFPLPDEPPAMPCYLLTDAGAAIAKIFPANDAFSRYFAKLDPSLGAVLRNLVRKDDVTVIE